MVKENQREKFEKVFSCIISGVDDGQFARILNFEIPQIKSAFQGKFLFENKMI